MKPCVYFSDDLQRGPIVTLADHEALTTFLFHLWNDAHYASDDRVAPGSANRIVERGELAEWILQGLLRNQCSDANSRVHDCARDGNAARQRRRDAHR